MERRRPSSSLSILILQIKKTLWGRIDDEIETEDAVEERIERKKDELMRLQGVVKVNIGRERVDAPY
jgi:hypothetical protein